MRPSETDQPALPPGPRGRQLEERTIPSSALIPIPRHELDPAPAKAVALEVADFIGRGLAWPMLVDHSGSISLTRGAADLDSSVRLVLLTAPGERLMRPEFGCRIHELVFEPINANTLGLMRHAVREALVRWEPRVTVEDIDVVVDPEASGLVHIHLGYRVRATNDRRNLVHPFYLIPHEGDSTAKGTI
jgi:phage baseplate assembly protein W